LQILSLVKDIRYFESLQKKNNKCPKTTLFKVGEMFLIIFVSKGVVLETKVEYQKTIGFRISYSMPCLIHIPSL
jgi:hypothetical protein